MSIPINIQGTIIQFPESAASPNYAPAIIQFAQAVAAALSSFVGPFDIAPQTLAIDAYNPGTNIDIPLLVFPPTAVRGALISYTVFRQTTTVTVSEVGEIMIVYNDTLPIGNKWQLNVMREGDASTTISITDIGQMQFSTALLGGLNHIGTFSYQAKAILNAT